MGFWTAFLVVVAFAALVVAVWAGQKARQHEHQELEESRPDWDGFVRALEMGRVVQYHRPGPYDWAWEGDFDPPRRAA